MSGFPQFPFSLPDYLSTGTMMEWVLYFALFLWALHSLVAVYHWIRYSHASLFALPAIALHLFVSFEIVHYGFFGKLYFPL